MPKFLFKANDNVLSHCRCVNQPAMSTCQLDCPWCGCGWLISCSKCLSAFTFAEVREAGMPLVELGRREMKVRGLIDLLNEDDLAEWAQAMSEVLDCFEIGDRVVYLDGNYWTVDSTNVEFRGDFAIHKFDRLPHFEALTNPSHLEAVLGSKDYWLSRERPDRE